MATVTWKDNVVILGGKDKEGNKRNTVILYNVTTGSHRMLPEMRKKRYGCTAVTIGDNIIVIGGWMKLANLLILLNAIISTATHGQSSQPWLKQDLSLLLL